MPPSWFQKNWKHHQETMEVFAMFDLLWMETVVGLQPKTLPNTYDITREQRLPRILLNSV
jgi:hypothetical protein